MPSADALWSSGPLGVVSVLDEEGDIFSEREETASEINSETKDATGEI